MGVQDLTVQMVVIVVIGVFFASFMDAIAGGGGIISVPTYLLAGLPMHFALGTNKFSSSIGTAFSTGRYIKNGYVDWKLGIPSIVLALIGSFFGTKLQLMISEVYLQYLLLIVLPVVAFVVLRQRQLPEERGDIEPKKQMAIVYLAALVVGAYDGFYGPGTGTFLLLIFCNLGKLDVRTAGGNVKLVNLSSNIASLLTSLLSGKVFLVLGLITLILAVLCAVIVRNHPSDRGLPSIEDVELSERGIQAVESSAARIPVLQGLRIVFSGGRKFWTCALAYFLVYGTIMTFQGTWAVTYFNSVYGFVLSASWMVTALGIGKILSTLAIGAMTTRGIIRSKRKAMIYGTTVFAALWVIIFAFAGEIQSYWFWFAVSFAFGFFGGFMTLSFTQVKEWYPIAVAGTAVSGTNIFLFLGASICTTISGAIVGTAYTLDNFTVLWGIMALFAIVAVVLLVFSVEKRPEDPPVGVELVRAAEGS